MKRSRYLLFLFPLILLAESCKTSADVAGNNLIQKRKYNKGFYFASLFHSGKKGMLSVYEGSRTQFSSAPSSIEKKSIVAKTALELADETRFMFSKIMEPEKSKFAAQSENVKTTPLIIEKVNQQYFWSQKKKMGYLKDDVPNDKVPLTSVLAFIGGIICILGVVILLAFPPTEASVTAGLLAVVWGGLGGLYFGSKSLKKIKDNPEQKKGKVLATFGLWTALGVATLGFLFLLIAMMASGMEF